MSDPEKSRGGIHWNGTIGPSFVVVLALSILTGVSWIYDSKADVAGRVIKLETQIGFVLDKLIRIDNKLDTR